MASSGQEGQPSQASSQTPGQGQGQSQSETSSQSEGGQAGFRTATAGENSDVVPDSLRKAGFSSDDWTRLKGNGRSNVDTSRGSEVPVEYRDLVNKYFQEISRRAEKAAR